MEKDFEIDVEILDEAGFNASMIGISLSHDQDPKDMPKVAKRLAPMDMGHNKFLESMIVWFMVRSPRYVWQQADTYRISTKQSESTMHTVMQRPLRISDFEVDGITRGYLAQLNKLIKDGKFFTLKKRMPESIMQKREWCMSYKTLRNIILQRAHHRLPHWKSFAEQALRLVQHPEFLPSLDGPKKRNEIPPQIGIHLTLNSRVRIGSNYWKVHRFLDGGFVLMVCVAGGGLYNMILPENQVINESLL